MHDDWIEKEHERVSAHTQCCLSLRHRNMSKFGSCQACMNYDTNSAFAKPSCDLMSMSSILPTSEAYDVGPYLTRGCTASLQNYNPAQFVTLCCSDDSQTYSLSSTRSQQSIAENFGLHNDQFIEKHRNGDVSTLCRELRLQQKYNWLPVPDIRDLGFNSVDLDAEITGLACETNRTLNFYVMDADRSEAFRHGLDGAGRPNQSSSVFIVDIEVMLLALRLTFALVLSN